jgi:type IV pilus assembly protein PilN
MIRINLLAVDRSPLKKTRAVAGPTGVTPSQRVTIGAALILLATVVWVGWSFWSIRAQGLKLDKDIAQAEKESSQLRSVLTKVQQFEARKAQLQQRVSLIEQLRHGQNAPVHVLDEVSKAIPDRLWLVSMLQRGDDFTIEGRTTTLTGLSDFIASLESSPWFRKPVEIVDSAVDQSPNGDLVRFAIRATMQNPEAPPPPPPAGRGAPPAR